MDLQLRKLSVFKKWRKKTINTEQPKQEHGSTEAATATPNPPKPVCVKDCPKCCVEGVIRCCLSCQHSQYIIQYKSAVEANPDDLHAQLYSPVDAAKFWCRMDSRKQNLQYHKLKLADLPLSCPDWRPKFHYNPITQRIER